VLDECRSVAVQQRIEHGVWGGTTANQRLRTLFKADRQRRSTKRTITTNDPGGNPCNP
jgi:hypothetical protein